jgi:hypothetical protein
VTLAGFLKSEKVEKKNKEKRKEYETQDIQFMPRYDVVLLNIGSGTE